MAFFPPSLSALDHILVALKTFTPHQWSHKEASHKKTLICVESGARASDFYADLWYEKDPNESIHSKWALQGEYNPRAVSCFQRTHIQLAIIIS